MSRQAYPFDPSYGYTLADLLKIAAPEEPADFAKFWTRAYAEAMRVASRPEIRDTGRDEGGWRIFDLSYRSTDEFTIGGWLLAPVDGAVRRGFVIGHGYAGRDAPDLDLPFRNAALLFPCFRGMSRSRRNPISPETRWHVLHDIHKRDRYIHRGCVQDVWLAVSALLRLFPQTEGRIGYLGISLGGGIGAMALPWDNRLRGAHLNVPSLGNQPLRLRLPTLGSAASVQRFQEELGGRWNVLETLRYYDAAIAARRIRVPVHCACALSDPYVAPPGQFAIYNSLGGPKELFILDAGHTEQQPTEAQARKLKETINRFFANL